MSSKDEVSESDKMEIDQGVVKLPEGDSWYRLLTLPTELECTQEMFEELLAMKPKERGKVRIFGKLLDVPRWQKSYGEDYYFSGMNHKADKIENKFLSTLLKFVCDHSGLPYRQILINWYLDGTEYIGEHSDDEKQLVPNSAIYSFSFGATRDFVIKSKAKKDRIVLPLENNTVIIMGGEMQKYYKHGVPKRLKVHEPRINITMRLYNETG